MGVGRQAGKWEVFKWRMGDYGQGGRPCNGGLYGSWYILDKLEGF